MGASTHIFLEDDIIPDVHKLCRLCLCKTPNCLPIYRDPKSEACPDVALRILTCVGIEVSKDDCLPNKLCRQCYREIERCYIFRKKCEENNKKLQLHATAVRENKLLLENQSIEKSNIIKQENTKENIGSLLLVSKETKSVKTYSNRLANKKNGDLNSNTKKEIQESKPKVDSETVEPSFEAFLKTVLLQLGVVESKNEKLILQNPNVKALEIETSSGTVLVELTEEDDQDNTQNDISDNTITINKSVDSIQTPEETVSIKSERDTNGKNAVVGGGGGGGGEWARCETCGKGFATRSVLRRHERVHSGERPHVCRVCRRAFAQRSVMLRHELVHREQRPHQCLECPKSFTQRAALEAHALVHAEPQRRALSLRPCPHCHKVFLYASGLSRHMRVHSGRVYECGECARPFGDKSSLLRHLRSVPHPPHAPRGTLPPTTCHSASPILSSTLQS